MLTLLLAALEGKVNVESVHAASCPSHCYLALVPLCCTCADCKRQDCGSSCVTMLMMAMVAQAVMVAWAQASIPAKTDASQQLPPSSIESTTLLGRNESTNAVVSRVLAAISDPYVQLQSQTKNI